MPAGPSEACGHLSRQDRSTSPFLGSPGFWLRQSALFARTIANAPGFAPAQSLTADEEQTDGAAAPRLAAWYRGVGGSGAAAGLVGHVARGGAGHPARARIRPDPAAAARKHQQGTGRGDRGYRPHGAVAIRDLALAAPTPRRFCRGRGGRPSGGNRRGHSPRRTRSVLGRGRYRAGASVVGRTCRYSASCWIRPTFPVRTCLPRQSLRARPSRLPGLWQASGVIGPLPELADAAQGFGALVAAADADGPIRRVPLLVRAGGAVRPGLALETVRLAQSAGALIDCPRRHFAGRCAVCAARP